MREIKLTKGKVAIVDDSDYEVLSAFTWYFDGRGYASRTLCIGYPKCKHYRMHRQVLGIVDPKIHVDHINGDRLDNRKSNLRLCSNAENMRNRGALKSNTSGFKGVVLSGKDRWRAQIKFKRTYYYLGIFSTAEAAHEAYKSAAAKLHGEFANFGKTREAS
jgi:hypothetical protein